MPHFWKKTRASFLKNTKFTWQTPKIPRFCPRFMDTVLKREYNIVVIWHEVVFEFPRKNTSNRLDALE